MYYYSISEGVEEYHESVLAHYRIINSKELLGMYQMGSDSVSGEGRKVGAHDIARAMCNMYGFTLISTNG